MPGANANAPQAMGQDALKAMFNRTIVMCAENKISESNAFTLEFIDHLPDMVKSDHHNGDFNFQAASCGLEAGVKIFGYRVDATHKLVNTTLSGLNTKKQQSEAADGDNTGRAASGTLDDKDSSPELTLETKKDALNQKSTSSSTLVDPLFHKTSALFDQGGAQGLLVNNLHVLHGCEILFDSEQQLESAFHCADDQGCVDQALALDLAWQHPETGIPSVITPAIEALREEMEMREWSAPLEELVVQKQEPQGCPASSADHTSDAWNQYNPTTAEVDESQDMADNANMDFGQDNNDAWGDFDDGGDAQDTATMHTAEEHSQSAGVNEDSDTFFNSDAISGSMASGQGWAGPGFWRPTSLRQRAAAKQPAAPRRRTPKEVPEPIDFTTAVPKPDEFFVPASDKVTCLATAPTPLPTLPEDVGYLVDHLCCLSLKPHVRLELPGHRSQAAEQAGAGFHTEFADSRGDTCDGSPYGDEPSFDGAGFGDDGGHFDGDDGMDEDLDLVSAPRHVPKTSVKYSSIPKQVDIRALKEQLWSNVQHIADEDEKQELTFQELITQLPDNSAAGRVEDLSVHLCFICMLHLANEHGLTLKDSPHLDRLDVVYA